MSGALFDSEVTCTVFTREGGLLTKTIRPDGRGGVIKEPAAAMTAGTAETVALPFSEFGAFLRRLKANQALAHGVCGRDRVGIVSAAKFTGQADTICRTKEFFRYLDGWGIGMLDHDPKPGQDALSPAQLFEAVTAVWPEFADLPKVVTGSTSSYIFDPTGKPLSGRGSGFHCYFPIKPAAALPTLAEVLFKRLWLTGHGYIFISRDGKQLIRTIFDDSVFSPERLDFCAGAACVGCVQKLPAPEYHHGRLQEDAEVPLPRPLTPTEEAAFNALVAAAKEQARPEAEKVRAARMEQEVEILRKERGVDPVTAAAIVKARHEGRLEPGDFIQFQDGRLPTVAEILAAPEQYHGQPCADPLEPEEGASRAKLFVNDSGSIVINSFLHGGQTYMLRQPGGDPGDPQTDFAGLGGQGGQEDAEILAGLIERVKDDCGAVHTPETIAALARLKRTDKPEFMRLRAALKEANQAVVIGELDKDINAHLRQTRRGRPSSPAGHATPSVAGCTLPAAVQDAVERFRGELIRENDRGDEDLCPQSEAAALVADQLRGHYAYQVASASWFRFDGSHWQEIKQLEVDEAITALTYAGAAHLGFSNTYQNGVGALLLKSGNLALGPRPGGLIPFANGLLDMKAKTLVPTTPENAQTWRLPFDYIPGAQCPVFLGWLRNAVDGDEGTVRLLRAFFNALLTGRPDLQRFIHFTGPASTGKSTVGRLAGAIMGPDNCTTTSLKQLETNRFETANIFGKRLVTLEEVDKYGGSVNVLKAMTGQDPLRLERKNVQQCGSFIFQGQVIMSSNERFATSDYTSGIERRRVTIEFNRRISPAERVEWERRGGEEAILHPEIPGIILWALELTRDEVSAAFQTMPDRIRKANIDAALFNNPLADWMLESCLPGGRCQVGDGREVMSMTGERVYIGADEQLYANYLLWCRRSGREQVSLQRFARTLEDAAQQFGVTAKKHRTRDGRFVEGLRLRMPAERPWKDQTLDG